MSGKADCRRQIPGPPGYIPRLSLREASKVSNSAARVDGHRLRQKQKEAIEKPDGKAIYLKTRRSNDLKMKRAWDLATS